MSAKTIAIIQSKTVLTHGQRAALQGLIDRHHWKNGGRYGMIFNPSEIDALETAIKARHDTIITGESEVAHA